jgi:AcrR family transcriptional regulator
MKAERISPKSGNRGKPKIKIKRAPARLEPLWETEARSGPKMEARADILETAANAFMERGYAATTLDHVAERLGTTKGQIYHYYRSKVDLYFDVVVGAFFIVNDKTGPAANLADVSAAERLRQLAHAHAMVILTTYSFQRVALEATQYRLIARLSPRQDRAMSRIARLSDDYEATVSRLIAGGVASGEFEVQSVELATRCVIGSLNWLTVWFDPKKSKGPESDERIARGVANFVVAGLLPSTLQFKPAITS